MASQIPVSKVEYFLRRQDVRMGDSVTRYAHPKFGHGWLHFSAPATTYEARTLSSVAEMLRTTEAAAERGGYAVGFVSYEAGAAFELALSMRAASFPLLARFAIYNKAPAFYKELEPFYEEIRISLDDADFDEDEFGRRFDKVKELLQEGTAYQINLTFRLRFSSNASPMELFTSRCGINPSPYSTLILGEGWSIASFSPELLMQREGHLLQMRPMKGTRPTESGGELQGSEKDRAENLMIVDMVRHDLGSFADFGSVHVPDLFSVEKHRTVHQMTSTINATSERSSAEVLAKILPASSITGAPKISAAKEIAKLERSPRNVYCGTIGLMWPGCNARFSVAIRTALIDDRGRGEYGVGSGIVWDSEVGDEYRECMLKAEVLKTPAPQWQLLESVGLRAFEDSSLLDRHVDRMIAAAKELSIETSAEQIRQAINEHRLVVGGPAKLRVALNRKGALCFQKGESRFGKTRPVTILASHAVSSQNMDCLYKTASRDLYESHLQENPDFDDVLLYNERGNVTEFCNGSVVVLRSGELVTPPVADGCLRGVMVGYLVAKGLVRVGSLSVEEVLEAQEVYLCNAVVGLRAVQLHPTA